MKQSLLWWAFENRGRSPENLLRAAKEIGYSGIELAEQQYWGMIQRNGLEIVSIKAHESLTKGLNRRENRDVLFREIRSNIALAAQWNIPKLICFSGNRNGLIDEDGIEVTAENLSILAKDAEEAGVVLLLELLNSKVDHKDYQCDKTSWGIQVCNKVHSPNVKLLYDVYHMQIMEGDIIRTIRNNHRFFGHYHTAGNPGRHDLDETQELFYPAIIRAILETGYDGHIGQEFMPKGDPIAALRSAYASCTITRP